MRKVKLQMQISLDGFVAGPNGEMDWMTWNWDDKIKDYVKDLTAPVDTILLGRKMAGGFIGHWAKVALNPDDEGYTFGKKMTDTPKVVFTRTLERSEWENTVLAQGDLAAEIGKLKKEEGGDIILYGGAGFVSSMIEANLIDEYHLFVNPAIIGNGLGIFKEVTQRTDLNLVKTTAFDCGIVTLCYQPVR